MENKILVVFAFFCSCVLFSVFSSIPRDFFTSVIPAPLRSTPTYFQNGVGGGGDGVSVIRLVNLYRSNASSLGISREFLINPHNFSLVINQPNLCHRQSSMTFVGQASGVPSVSEPPVISFSSKTGKNFSTQPRHPLLLIAVLSIPEAFSRRQAIRDTWAQKSELEANDVKLVFILGRAKKNATQDLVRREGRQQGDIIQEDFVESFRNLTLKSIMGVKWAAYFCPGAKYFLKTDDDMFINLKQMVLYLGTLRGYRLAAGTCGSGGKVIRNERSKYFVPFAQYQQEKWPTYCSGTGYILSGDLLREVYITSLQTPYLYMEDVYVTGLCLKKLKDVKLFPRHRFLTNFRQLESEWCDIERLIMVHGVIEAKQYEVWKQLQECNKDAR